MTKYKQGDILLQIVEVLEVKNNKGEQELVVKPYGTEEIYTITGKHSLDKLTIRSRLDSQL